ncbi:MAG: 16S rRNA processing protein RimM [Crocinitomicaceae bacterium]|nr:16S rRNA processing protein RimM [Crocinitomicaceae bacterium]
MTIKDCFYLGKIAKLHGFKGEVSLFLDVTNPRDYKDLESVYIDVDGVLTPFFIESVKLKNKNFIAVKFQGVNDESSAHRLLKKSLYLPEEILPNLKGTQFYDHEIIGFKVLDDIHGDIGEVENVIDLAANPLLQTICKGKEVLVPIFDGLVQKIDRKNKILYIKAPEGLIDLYLSDSI